MARIVHGFLLAAGLLLAACGHDTAADNNTAADDMAGRATAGGPPPPPGRAPALPPAAGPSAPAFVDKVWRVAASSSLQPGTTYTFLRGGALVIDAPGGTPATGRWRQADGGLTLVEEGIAYPTDIVALDAGHLVLRSHHPGGTLLIPLVAAPELPLPRPAAP